jgi:hypothetical protein
LNRFKSNKKKTIIVREGPTKKLKMKLLNIFLDTASENVNFTIFHFYEKLRRIVRVALRVARALKNNSLDS